MSEKCEELVTFLALVDKKENQRKKIFYILFRKIFWMDLAMIILSIKCYRVIIMAPTCRTLPVWPMTLGWILI